MGLYKVGIAEVHTVRGELYRSVSWNPVPAHNHVPVGHPAVTKLPRHPSKVTGDQEVAGQANWPLFIPLRKAL